MFSSSSARSGARRRGRLLAACTTGVVAAGAFALGPAGIASADSGAPHQARFSAPQTTQHPTSTLRKHKKTSYSTAAAGTALTAPRYDYDNDGYSDLLVQNDDASFGVLSSAKLTAGQAGYTDLGTGNTLYRDVITPGNLTDSYAGTEVLALTASGRLSMFTDTNSLVNGYPVWTGTGWQVYNQIVAVGDTNGDGFGDLLARTPSGDLYLYKGTGNASAPFGGRVKVGYGYGIYDQLVGAGDITGTGYETLVARDLYGDLWMYKLDGTAANPLAARVKIGTGWNVYNQIIGWGDDGGSIGQILGRTANGDLWWYNGDGSGKGTLTKRVRMGGGWSSNVISGQGHTQVWGKADLFGLTSGGSLYYYSSYNTGVLSKRYLVGNAGAWKGSNLTTTVSLSDEGEQPLLEIYNGTLYNDTLGFENVSSSGWGGYNKVFGPGDLNGDGHSDLLARDKSGVLWDLTGKGDGSFYGRAKVGAGWGGYNQITGAGDINGDGLADIVARASNGHLYLYLGTGNGAAPFKARQDIGAGWNAYSKIASPGDMDGDGRADLVAVTPGGQLYRYSGEGFTGTATFKHRVEIGTAGWNGYSSLF
ncbi:FG-GAP repeat domain-containing protein [Actinacidiphila acidipaludis]|uniref:VCBS repeat-containing protein n=1 Tax=Actinacidiphila acidipaludis TaxID=2873382 RepID=A0ABS7Q344_9ACTN|nr:VCBS repeat-containing protein [Streptomyces acidipaludis]MBY8877550.1 VCBS repeat-containing protein [Streptomyces acidipaludis]